MAFLGLIPEPTDDVELRMTPTEVKREATGRAKGVWKQLPPQVSQNKAGTIIVVGLTVAGLIAYNMKKSSAARYGL